MHGKIMPTAGHLKMNASRKTSSGTMLDPCGVLVDKLVWMTMHGEITWEAVGEQGIHLCKMPSGKTIRYNTHVGSLSVEDETGVLPLAYNIGGENYSRLTIVINNVNVFNAVFTVAADEEEP